MSTRVIYFGMLAEVTGIQEEWIDPATISPDQELSDFFNERHAQLSNYHYTIAVNQAVCITLPTDEEIHEIALLPPFAGG